MAVVIKKMNIPESCYSCDIRMNCDACEGHEMYCPFVGHIGYDPESRENLVEGAPICPTDHRAEGCPLEDLEEITMSANDRQVTGKLNSEIEKSKSEIVPDYRDGWRLKEGGENET